MTGYPGNKSAWQVPAINATAIYDLFMGGGGWSRAALRSNPRARVVGAEANPIQRAILKGEELDGCLVQALSITGLMRDCIPSNWDGKGKFAELYPWERRRLGKVWRQWIKEPFDFAYNTGIVSNDAITAQICVSSFGYGCNIRISGNGLNVPPNPQKIRRGVPRCPQRVANLTSVYPTFRNLRIVGGIALIDPPYWLPPRYRKTHQKLTSCYPGHQPYGEITRKLYEDALQLSSNADLILVAGYYSEELDSIIRGMGRPTQAITHGTMQTQGNKNKHRHNLIHGNRSHPVDLPPPVEVEWIVSREPIKIERPEQLALFA